MHLVVIIINPATLFKVYVQVLPEMKKKILIYGPGTERAIVGQPARFTVEVLEGTDHQNPVDSIKFVIQGPSTCLVEWNQNKEGAIDAFYTPNASGPHVLYIFVEDQKFLQQITVQCADSSGLLVTI